MSETEQPQAAARTMPAVERQQQALQQGVALHRAGRLTEAESVYRAIVAANPEHEEAQRLLGLLAAQTGRGDEALALLTRVVAINPGSFIAWTNLAQVQKALARPVEAIASCDRALNIAPDAPGVLNLRGAIALDAGRHEEALACLDRLLARNGHHVEALYNRGLALQSLRRFDEALASYQRALMIAPEFPEALHNLGNVQKDLGRPGDALASFDRALALRPDFAEALSNRAGVLRSLGRREEALASCDRALRLMPNFAEAWNMRGAVLNELGRYEEALANCEQALSHKPGLVAAFVNRAAALAGLGQPEEALASCEKVLALAPGDYAIQEGIGAVLIALGHPERALACFDRVLTLVPDSSAALWNRGVALHALRRLDEALASLDRAIALDPGVAEMLNFRAGVLKDLKRIDLALADWDRAIALKPDFAEAHRFRGSALAALKRCEEAIASYDRALAIRPDFVEALHNRATALSALNRHAEALASCDQALVLRLGHADEWHNRGSTLSAMHRYDEAVASYSRALAEKPDAVGTLQNRGSVLMFLSRFEEASRDFARVLAIDDGHLFARSMLMLSRLHACDWRDHAELVAQIVASAQSGSPGIEPFSFLLFSDSAPAQLQCARGWTADKCPPSPTPLWRGERYAHDRIRVAYLSADFHEHATAYLMAELFEHHDRARFEVTGVSYGPSTNDAMRGRLAGAFERFIDVQGWSDREVAQRLRELEIDIAVDLKGYTYDGRTEILSRRPSPVQVSYLGYPGTLGAPYIDYVVADGVVIPEGEERHYAEQVVRLPDSYQVNDRQRRIAGQTPTRGEAGLPEGGVVFCSFNNNYKITPEVFGVWMGLLRQVEGSVLWLLEGNAVAPGNLRREAQARGIAPERLVFAPRTGLAEHLARHRLADLFLDTLPCNAHTTASDALWAGLPVVTCQGRTFAGRVAGSLLTAVGLPELITRDLGEYEALALRLAREPEALSAVKAKLARNRDSCPLFDVERFRRHLEAAYETMWGRAQRGEAPAGFSVQRLA